MSSLSPRQLFALDEACKPIREAFGQYPYLVGTASQDKVPYRDVDVRLILPDEKFDELEKSLGRKALTLIGFSIGEYLASRTSLPIDFQFQRLTEANEKHPDLARNPLGIRKLNQYIGDAWPENNEEDSDG